MTRFSRPVRISSTAANCPVRLIDCRTSSGFEVTSNPFYSGGSGVLFQQRGEDFNNRCLARAVGAKQGEYTALSTSKSTPFRT